jgi:hypothetical protein
MNSTQFCQELSLQEMSELNGGWMFSSRNQAIMGAANAVDDFFEGISSGFSEGFGQWVDNGFL